MTMTVAAAPKSRLRALPQFVRYASTYPDPPALLRALRAGPLAHRHMVAGFLWLVSDGTHLVSIAQVGWKREMVERYSIIPLELDLPAAHTVLDDRVTIDRADSFGEVYLSALDESLLGETFEDLDAASVIAAPVRHAGMCIGALGLVTSAPWEDDEDGRSLLDCLSHLLGLWAAHPSTTTLDSQAPPAQREWSLAFTQRQKQVLTLAGDGLSNTDIARRLVISTSSVKQDLQHTMRALRTHSRQGAYERAKDIGLLS